jgi:hypothetical protein
MLLAAVSLLLQESEGRAYSRESVVTNMLTYCWTMIHLPACQLCLFPQFRNRNLAMLALPCNAAGGYYPLQEDIVCD